MKKFILAALAMTALSTQAQSYDRNNVMFGLGVDNLREGHDSDNSDIRTIGGRVEWRGKAFDNVWGIHNISPLVGADVDGNGAFAVFAGLLYDWNFYDRWSLVPNIGVGAYSHGGGKDLGGVLEFHDSIELNYKLDPINRLGLELTHMSNASIYDHNPGKEDLMLTFTHGL